MEDPKEELEEKEKEAASAKSSGEPKEESEEKLDDVDDKERFVSEEVEPEIEEEESRKYFHSSSTIYAGSPHSRSGKRIPFVLGIVVILLILGGLFYFFRTNLKSKQEPSPSPVTKIEEPSPQASPSPSFERTQYTLRVLNGTKTQGLAASTSAGLKELGYRIEKTANATNSAFLKTVIRVKPELEELLENLLKDLSGLDFEGEEGPELKESDTSDGEIILGAE